MSTFNFYSQNNPILLSTEKLDIGYEADILIKELTLNIRHGEIIALIGENGSGKSTLIRTLAGLQNPLAGGITLNEIPIQQVSMHDKAKMMASVSTITTENIMLTGYKFVSHGRYPYIGWNGRLRAIDHEVINDSINLVKATHLAQRPIHSLSDGEMQRLVIARALAQEPDLIFLDEPTVFLDQSTKLILLNLLRNLSTKRGLAIVAATHDLDYFQQISDTVWNIDSNKSPHKLYSSNTEDYAVKLSQNSSAGIALAVDQVIRPNKIFISAPQELEILAQQLFNRHGWEITDIKLSSDYAIALNMNPVSQKGQIHWSITHQHTQATVSGDSFEELVTATSSLRYNSGQML